VSDTRAGNREQSPMGTRSPRGLMRFNDIEWAVIAIVADRDGKRPGAWAQQAAYEAAVRQNLGKRTDLDAVAALTAALREHRRVLTNIGGNLNDVARVANSTGAIENATVAHTVMRLIGNVVRTSDVLVRDIRRKLMP
jgi:hypothetical protein